MSSGYVIAQLKVTNSENYKEYVSKVTEVVKKFGGEYIVRNGEYKVVDGKRVRVEVPMDFYPKFYSVDNAWIDDQEMRGKGHGKAIYEEWRQINW